MEGLQTGRIVHFNGSENCRAAIVTEVRLEFGDGVVDLYVFPDGNQEPGGVLTSIPPGITVLIPTTWHWPERT